VVENEDLLLVHVKFGLRDLTFFFFVLVERELLSHLFYNDILYPVIYKQEVVTSRAASSAVRIECYTSVDHSILSVLVALKGLASNVLLAVDKTIVISMVVEI
jgi:hypothetical protein